MEAPGRHKGVIGLDSKEMRFAEGNFATLPSENCITALRLTGKEQPFAGVLQAAGLSQGLLPMPAHHAVSLPDSSSGNTLETHALTSGPLIQLTLRACHLHLSLASQGSTLLHLSSAAEDEQS